MADFVVEQENMTLEDVAFALYGARPELLSALISGNRHLCEDVFLRIGTVVVIPEAKENQKIKKSVSVWD